MNETKTIMQYIARVHKDEKKGGQWVAQNLNDHLHGVAKKAGEFAQVFESGDWASVAGLWREER